MTKINEADLKVGMNVRCCSQKGKCMLIAPIKKLDRANRVVYVEDFLGHTKTYSFDRLKSV